jgi:hypothetical protein
MKIFFNRKLLLVAVSFLVTFTVQTTTAEVASVPNPVLTFMGQEQIQAGGKSFVRYYFDVFNKDEYPAELFAAAPALPPCGQNAKASRTWVDIYDQSGKRLNGFCAFGKPGDLTRIWFALDESELPPSWVYIELNDRQTNTKYKSNLAETTL